MSDSGSLITTLVTGGLGAALGSIATALIQVVGSKGVSRAEAADRVTAAAGNLADRLDRMNARLEAENRQMRRAIIAITEVMDEVIPLIPDAAVRERMHDAITAAQVSMR